MDSDSRRRVVLAALWLGIVPVGQAVGTDTGLDGGSWQKNRLLHPTAGQRQREASGRVFIYDGLEYGTVEQAMDQHFGRIQSMMFTRIHHLPPTPSGQVTVEDDDCD